MPEIVSVILVGVPDAPDSVATQTTCLSEDRRNAVYAAGSDKPDTPVRFYLHTGCPSRVLQIHIAACRAHAHRRAGQVDRIGRRAGGRKLQTALRAADRAVREVRTRDLEAVADDVDLIHDLLELCLNTRPVQLQIRRVDRPSDLRPRARQLAVRVDLELILDGKPARAEVHACVSAKFVGRAENAAFRDRPRPERRVGCCRDLPGQHRPRRLQRPGRKMELLIA